MKALGKVNPIIAVVLVVALVGAALALFLAPARGRPR